MTDIAIGPDYDPAKEILTDASGRPITTGYVAQLAEEAEAGYELGQARTLTAADLTAMRTRGRPTPGTGQSRAVSVRMNRELLTELHAAAACHVPVSTLIREAAAQWLHRHAHLTMTRDDEWCTKVLNTFIATVESLEEVQRAPMAPGGPSLVDPAYQRQVETLRRAVRSEFTSASVALDQVIHDWGGRKAGFFTSKEAHQKELAQEAIALIERREEHAAHGGLDQPPGLDEEQLHRWVWEAARGLWRSGHHRQAVAAAVEAVVSEVQNRTGYGLSGAPLFEAAFNAAEPKSDGPRLMLMPFEKSETYRNVQNGVKSLGQACVSALRNPAAHGNRNQLHPQMALEQLAMISVLARWVEQSQVKRHDDDIAVSSEVTEVDFVKTFEAALHDGAPQ